MYELLAFPPPIEPTLNIRKKRKPAGDIAMSRSVLDLGITVATGKRTRM